MDAVLRIAAELIGASIVGLALAAGLAFLIHHH